ncbi:MAG TPA: DUF6491 family protein [Rhodanobacteraceae bacterium]|nr:DUF6491 family protein [Rhodanobacteraceae bacterium]
MKQWMTTLLAAGALAGGFAHADTPATQQKSLEKYTPYLQAPVDDFLFWSLYKWQLVGPDKVVVWPTIKQAYLLTVEQPCPKLEWAHGIGFTSKQIHHITRRIDYLTADGSRCRIVEIQPIDTARMDRDLGLTD